ncbi:hypothetical protein [Flavobacterium sp.]|uniref:hypothetical protein n=1 Tax=Flavobacterium sp. TaxID=239 RepID=UPI002FDA80D1
MKKIFYPKIFLPSIKLIFIIGFFYFLFLGVVKFIDKPKSHIDLGFIISAIVFSLFIGYVIFHLGYFFCFYFKYASLNENVLSIFELNKLKTTKVNLDQISGYSKSEVYFGRYTWKSKSIVIYFKLGKTSEILSSFVSGVDDLEKELKKRKVKYLGFEHYNTGWFFREYKFNK